MGFEAGEYLAQHAKKVWGGKARWVLGLDIEEAGVVVQSRITGALEAIRSNLPSLSEANLVRMDARGMREKSYRLVLDFIRRHPKDRGILIAAATDTSALGAVRAIRELKWEKYAAIVGQDCIPEALEEMALPDSPLIASVSHQAHTYGPGSFTSAWRFSAASASLLTTMWNTNWFQPLRLEKLAVSLK